MCNTYYDCWITLQTTLKIDASDLYCKITLIWLASSLSVLSGGSGGSSFGYSGVEDVVPYTRQFVSSAISIQWWIIDPDVDNLFDSSYEPPVLLFTL